MGHIPLPRLAQRAPAGRLGAAQNSTLRSLETAGSTVRSTSAILEDFLTSDFPLQGASHSSPRFSQYGRRVSQFFRNIFTRIFVRFWQHFCKKFAIGWLWRGFGDALARLWRGFGEASARLRRGIDEKRKVAAKKILAVTGPRTAHWMQK